MLNIMRKVLVAVVMAVCCSAAVSAKEFQGNVRGVYLKTNGLFQLFMDSDISTEEQCPGVFDTKGFQLTVNNENAHIVAQWMPLLEAARQAKLAQIASAQTPPAAQDPALVKVGYDIQSNGTCEIKYVYYLHWYDI